MRILILEDHEHLRTTLTRWFSQYDDLEVEAYGFLEEAKEAYGKVEFDLVLSDHRLPDGRAFPWVRELHDSGKTVAMFTSDEPTREMLESGVRIFDKFADSVDDIIRFFRLK